MIFGKSGQVEPESDHIPAESMSMLVEAMLLEEFTEEEMNSFLDDSALGETIEEGILTERSIVRLDKQAKISHLRQMAIFTIAKEKNDPMFRRLMTVWRMERYLEAYLDKKYGNEATRRARQGVTRTSSSKAPSLQLLTKRATQRLSPPTVKPNGSNRGPVSRGSSAPNMPRMNIPNSFR